MPAPTSTAKNSHYGKFATTSRLVACLVSEGLVSTYFCPRKYDAMVGLCIMVRVSGNGPAKPLTSQVELSDILAVVPLRGLPELDANTSVQVNGVKCTKIGLVDPWDMLPHIYSPNAATFPAVLSDSEVVYRQVIAALSDMGICNASLNDGYDAVQLWQQFAHDFGVTDKLTDQLASELASSMLHQSKLFFFCYYHQLLTP